MNSAHQIMSFPDIGKTAKTDPQSNARAFNCTGDAKENLKKNIAVYNFEG